MRFPVRVKNAFATSSAEVGVPVNHRNKTCEQLTLLLDTHAGTITTEHRLHNNHLHSQHGTNRFQKSSAHKKGLADASPSKRYCPSLLLKQLLKLSRLIHFAHDIGATDKLALHV